MATAALITGSVRSLMGDDDSAVYTDATLIIAGGQGPVNNAYRLVQTKMATRGCTVLKDTSAVVSVPAGNIIISASSSPALPTDFIVPYDLWERTTGSTSNSDWQLMNRGDTIPDRDKYSYLGDWKFEGGGVDLVGATVAVDVKMVYEKLLTPFAATSDPVAILGAEDCIAYYTCALMAMSRGQANMSAYFEKKADDALEELVNRFTHSNQAVHGRRRLGYGRRATARH